MSSSPDLQTCAGCWIQFEKYQGSDTLCKDCAIQCLGNKCRKLEAENERLRAIMDGAADEAVRILTVIDAARRLVDALPKCDDDGCSKPATRSFMSVRFCDRANVTEYPHAQPLRDMIAALAELDKETG